MKKSLFAIFAVAACFASCSEVIDSPVVDNPITFDNYVGKDATTRASVIKDVRSVNVNAYLHPATTTGGTDFKANFMSEQAITSEDGKNWTYSPMKYWPATDQAIDFVGWIPDGKTPSNISIRTVQSESGKHLYGNWMDFTVPTEIKDQSDLIVAEPRLDENKVGDNSSISLVFKHLLSRIGFEIIATNVPGPTSEETVVELSHIKLSGAFPTAGEVNMVSSPIKIVGLSANTPTANDNPTVYTLTGEHFGWRDNTIANIEDDTKINVIRSGKSSNSLDSYIMLIPSQPEKINVTYTVKTYEVEKDENGNPVKDDNGNVVKTQSGETMTNTKDFDLSETMFEAGKAYKFIFYITMAGISFDVEVENWDETHIQDINPEDGAWVTLELKDSSKIYHKGTLMVGTLIYVDSTDENGKVSKVSAGDNTYELKDGTNITVAGGKVTKIETPKQ